MQHPGLIQQLPTLRSIGLAILVCLFGMTVLSTPVMAFQDETTPDETAVPVDDAADAATPAADGGTDEAATEEEGVKEHSVC
jgi:hypothetical protein